MCYCDSTSSSGRADNTKAIRHGQWSPVLSLLSICSISSYWDCHLCPPSALGARYSIAIVHRHATIFWPLQYWSLEVLSILFIFRQSPYLIQRHTIELLHVLSRIFNAFFCGRVMSHCPGMDLEIISIESKLWLQRLLQACGHWLQMIKTDLKISKCVVRDISSYK